MKHAKFVLATLGAIAVATGPSAAKTDEIAANEGIVLNHDDPRVSRVAKTLELDTRLPTLEDLSGVWGINPCVAGPSHHFQLEQKEDRIAGLGYFSGCVGCMLYSITGSRHGATLDLVFKYSDGEVQKTTMTIVDFFGVVGLQQSAADKYPLVPRLLRTEAGRRSAKKRKRPNKALEPTPTAVTPAAGQPARQP